MKQRASGPENTYLTPGPKIHFNIFIHKLWWVQCPILGSKVIDFKVREKRMFEVHSGHLGNVTQTPNMIPNPCPWRLKIKFGVDSS